MLSLLTACSANIAYLLGMSWFGEFCEVFLGNLFSVLTVILNGFANSVLYTEDMGKRYKKFEWIPFPSQVGPHVAVGKVFCSVTKRTGATFRLRVRYVESPERPVDMSLDSHFRSFFWSCSKPSFFLLVMLVPVHMRTHNIPIHVLNGIVALGHGLHDMCKAFPCLRCGSTLMYVVFTTLHANKSLPFLAWHGVCTLAFGCCENDFFTCFDF